MKCAGLPLQSPAPSDRRNTPQANGDSGRGKDARPLFGIKHTQ